MTVRDPTFRTCLHTAAMYPPSVRLLGEIQTRVLFPALRPLSPAGRLYLGARITPSHFAGWRGLLIAAGFGYGLAGAAVVGAFALQARVPWLSGLHPLVTAAPPAAVGCFVGYYLPFLPWLPHMRRACDRMLDDLMTCPSCGKRGRWWDDAWICLICDDDQSETEGAGGGRAADDPPSLPGA